MCVQNQVCTQGVDSCFIYSFIELTVPIEIDSVKLLNWERVSLYPANSLTVQATIKWLLDEAWAVYRDIWKKPREAFSITSVPSTVSLKCFNKC